MGTFGLEFYGWFGVAVRSTYSGVGRGKLYGVTFYEHIKIDFSLCGVKSYIFIRLECILIN